ncbi:Tex family protein [Pokkaliibacter sp. CJK22405]|uniref:Tex family protein n=1 Tax=Pokkaliibacter sp. CJK22405 TaxID=3384615 RepID=UPI003984D20E
MSSSTLLQATPLAQRLATSLAIKPWQVEAVISLMDEGATVPFIARYRKEKTGALDDAVLRDLAQALDYQRDLDKRRDSILGSLKEQGITTPSLLKGILDAESKQVLEDLYLPYRPKRQTKGSKAREAGLEPLADQLVRDSSSAPEKLAVTFVSAEKGINSAAEALEGARAILLERFSEAPTVLASLRQWLSQNAWLAVRAKRGKADPQSKFRDYFDYRERLSRAAGHRLLAIFRGEREGVLNIDIEAGEQQNREADALALLQQGLRQDQLIGNQLSVWLRETVQATWAEKLLPGLGKDALNQAKDQAELEAIKVFALNLRDVLLAAPAGGKVTLGLDPGIRTGIKLALVDATGRVVTTDTLYAHAPRNEWDRSLATIVKLCQQHQVELIAVGNGTASRETEQLAREAVAKLANDSAKAPQVVMVSEAGASVYSASALASAELPALDVSLRGAVSIARRLQDPLAELVKIEPKAIGVGQYQHDVAQTQLAQSLAAVVEDCVNAVGVDLNTASSALLAHVSGLNTALAEAIVLHRDQQGPFERRKDLLAVPRLGPKTFQQAAGFLRIREGKEPLDASAVHPESYDIVKQMAKSLGARVEQLLGAPERVGQLNLSAFASDAVGEYTLKDICEELLKPGRDPRPAFKTAQFAEGVNAISDLAEGMQLEGVVTNVTDFGAFVDIGVHQDGLVHISQLADVFVKHPRDVVQSGQLVKVQVMEVDVARKRISLSMRQNPELPVKRSSNERPAPAARPRHQQSAQTPSRQPEQSAPQGALAAALSKARDKR